MNSNINQLSARKQAEYAQVKQNVIDAGVQYDNFYSKFSNYGAKIDTDEKREAVVFLLDELLELVDFDFKMCPVIEELGDPKTKDQLNYREFKLLQEVIKSIKVRGRNNIIKLSKALKAFNDAGNELNDLEVQSQQFAKLYQEAGAHYAKTCQRFGILPEDLDKDIEAAVATK